MSYTQAFDKDTGEDTPKAKKSVQWAANLTMRFISMSDEEEKVATWYQSGDYKTFKRRCKIMAHLAQDVGSEVVEVQLSDTCRGLEYLANKSRTTQRIIRRNKAWGAVLDEQSNHSPEFIGELYYGVCAESQWDAHQLALRYARESECAYSAGAQRQTENSSTNKKVAPQLTRR
jgi:hypothetical protein